MINSTKEKNFGKLVQGFTSFDVDEGIVVGGDALIQSIEFIGSHLDPEDVFPDSDLQEWARKKGFQ